MNLYLLARNDIGGYDTYDRIVVCAESEEAARYTHPEGHLWRPKLRAWEDRGDGRMYAVTNDGKERLERAGFCAGRDYAWAQPEDVNVRYLGEADPSIEAGVVLASYDAG